MFNSLFMSVAQILAALVSEATMRRFSHEGKDADLAESVVIASSVELATKLIDSMTQIPSWIAATLKNPVMLAQFAKWADDQVEFYINKGFDEMEKQFKPRA